MLFRCVGVLTAIQGGLRFYANLETDRNASWRPQDAENDPTETFLDDVVPQVEIKWGLRSEPKSVQNDKNERYH